MCCPAATPHSVSQHGPAAGTAAEILLHPSLRDAGFPAPVDIDAKHRARRRAVGDDLWGRFNASKEETLWYYRELSRVFSEHNPGYLADELRRTVEEIRRLAE